MRTLAMSVLLTGAMVSAGCGATRKVANAVAPGSAVTAATMMFIDRDHGKDAKSAVDVWLLHGTDEMAHLHSVGTKFDDNASIAPMAMQLSGAFHAADLKDGQLRIRLTPDGRDDWSFEPRLTLSFSDNTSRSYTWPLVALDNNNAERTLSFSSAVQVP